MQSPIGCASRRCGLPFSDNISRMYTKYSVMETYLFMLRYFIGLRHVVDAPRMRLLETRHTRNTRMKIHSVGAALAALIFFGCAQAAEPTSYDIVIRNGRVLDGAGNPWVGADVAITDGKFAKIGRVEGRGKREIDAKGDYVSPGWIDMMDQSGAVLLKNGLAENKLREGVTTAIAGEAGTPVPAAQLDDYFNRLQSQGISLNFGTYYSSAQARVEVMGDVAGKPTPQQMEQMKQRVADGYGGIYASHMRDESAKLLDAINESIEIGEKSGIQVEIFHFKAAYSPGWCKLVPQAGQLIAEARARGVSIATDMYVYTAGGTGLDITVPNWVWEGGQKKGLQLLKDPKV